MSEKVGKIGARCVDWCIRCVRKRKHWVNDFCWRWTVRASRGFHYKPTLTGSRFRDSLSFLHTCAHTYTHTRAQYLLINQLMEVNRARNWDQNNWRQKHILPEEVLKHNRMTKINWNDATWNNKCRSTANKVKKTSYSLYHRQIKIQSLIYSRAFSNLYDFQNKINIE